MSKEDKKKLEKRLTIGLQVFALIGLIIIGFYLGKAYKARRANSNKQETIKDFGTTFKKFTIDSDQKKYSVKIDGKTIDIENKDSKVYINNKKMEFGHAMGGYTLDKVLLLYDVGQIGEKIMFFNKDGDVIPSLTDKYSFTNLSLVSGKIEGHVYNDEYNNSITCQNVSDLEICECSSLESGELLKVYKDRLEKVKDEIIEAKAILSYDGKEVTTAFEEKVTIGDKYGKDIDGTSKTYCVATKN